MKNEKRGHFHSEKSVEKFFYDCLGVSSLQWYDLFLAIFTERFKRVSASRNGEY